jgi:ATP synthase protein I
MRNVLIIQAILVLAGVTVSRYYFGDVGLLPAFYGGAVALANTLLLTRKIAQAGEAAKDSPQQSLYVIALGAVQRFVFVLVALGFGLGYLKLVPQPLLGTFAVAQLVYMLAAKKN